MMPSSSRRSSFGSRNGSVASALRRSINSRNGTADRQDQTNGSHGDGIMTVPVVGYEVKEETGRFTVFKLQVANEELCESWLVFRRYTDFERLAAKLREDYPLLPILSLPPKRWLKNNFDTTFLEDRMKGIQAFVDNILIQHKLATNHTVRTFFCLDEPPVYPENAEESRAIFGTLEEDILQLRDDLNKRDKEIRVLKQELELYKLRNETLTKMNSRRVCRSCNTKLSSTTLSFGPRTFMDGLPIPIQSSTPNPKNGHFFRMRNKSAGNETLSVPPSPERRFSLKMAERDITSTEPLAAAAAVAASYETESQVPSSSEIDTPVETLLKAEHEQDVPVSRPILDNHKELDAEDGIDNNGNGSEVFMASPFEILSPTASTPISASDGTNRNSSFELLSSSCPESESPSDDNHNKIPTAAHPKTTIASED